MTADPLSDAHEMPDFVAPMLARLSTMPPRQSQWAFEVKWDGVRAIARCRPGRLALLTRNGNEVSAAYPELRGLLDALGSREAMLDGEIVGFDSQGRPSFQALQSRMHLRGDSAVMRRAAQSPVTYMVFDLLWLDGHSLMGLPYEQRRARLAELKLDGDHWRTPAQQVGDGEALLAATREQGLEGIVAKRLDSTYAPGRRDAGWLKIKNSRRQELVIGGWTEGKGARRGRFGALELGVHDDRGELRYAGKVGTGFSEAELDRLMGLMKPLARRTSPFGGRQPERGTHFLRPELVAEVEFSEWTRDGRLRQASYRGLREDKAPREVVRERVVAPPEAPAARPEPAREGPAAAHKRRGAAREGREAARPEPARGSRGTACPALRAGAGLSELLDAGRPVAGGVEVRVGERTLKLTNLDKVLYPAVGFTKGELIDRYMRLAPALVPHLRDRPLTLKRYPDGVEGKRFYEKHAPRHRPDWVQTVAVSSKSKGRDIDYVLCQDLPTLVWLANLADVELHPSLSRAPRVERPSAVVFDLDPGAPAGMRECCEVALELRELFEGLALRAFAKTSGSKGLQVYVPLNDPRARYEHTKPFAHAVANLMQERHPKRVISAMSRARRRGKVLIDWSQNDEHKTTVSVYSLRAMERPTVSTPVEWKEVEEARGGRASLSFDAEQAIARIAEKGDLFADVLSLRQRLPDLGAGGG